jgi:type VI secretion system protein ImpC
MTLKAGSEVAGRELPFVIGVLADLSGMPERPLARLRDRRFISIELANFDEVLAGCRPHLTVTVTNKLADEDDSSQLRVDLAFHGLKDFAPENIVQQIQPLRALTELRGKLIALRTTLLGNDGLDDMIQDALNSSEKLDRLKAEIDAQSAPFPQPPHQPPAHPQTSLLRKGQETPASPPERGVWSRAKGAEEGPILSQLVDASLATRPQEREATQDYLTEFVSEILNGNMRVERDTEAMISARVSQIDHLVSIQLREVLHHPDFMRLESSWRGLHFLVSRTRKAEGVQVRVLNIAKSELLRQFVRKRKDCDSTLSRKVLNDAAGTLGASPLGLLISDFSIRGEPQDAELMEKMARLGAEAHVPFLVAADPDFLGFSNFSQIVDVSPLNRISNARYTRWNHLRASHESRYIGLVLPRMLLRVPYRRGEDSGDNFDFDEVVDFTDRSQFLWGSPVWPFAVRQAADFARYGWFGAQRSLDDPGELTDLPASCFQNDDGDVSWVGPVEISLSDTRYLELRSLGFIPLCQIAGTNRATFFEAWSCHKPKIDPDADARTTYESAEIDCVLAVSRIAHYLRCILQTERQRFSSVEDCEEYLRRWIAQYVVPEYAKGTSLESAFPLLSAQFRIELTPEPQRPSSLHASLVPRRAVGTLPHAAEIVIPIPLPWALSLSPTEPHSGVVQVAARTTVLAPRGPYVNGFTSGRDQFIRRTFMAETCITNRKLDVAIQILEGLAEQIDRYHLDEWESPQLVTQVWDLLRRCYLLTSSAHIEDDRSAALLHRICRLDPSRAIE